MRLTLLEPPPPISGHRLTLQGPLNQVMCKGRSGEAMWPVLQDQLGRMAQSI